MYGDDELGIPGHASHVEPVREFQKTLSMLGLRFEAEGDITRIHLDNLIVEIKDIPGDGVAIEAILPLPPGTGEDPGSYTHLIDVLLRLLRDLGPGFRIEYYADEAAPGYPVLRATIRMMGLEEAYALLDSALRKLFIG